MAAGNAPDLRGSAAPQDIRVLSAIVREGALIPRGMPRFEELTDSQIADLSHYLRAETALARGWSE
jgi:quinohemoprotein ethanol dehydrogenase